ncbi:hypothetical protein OPV22_002615 [Ensete ventricosum]|uniref:Uncharacterized protein n=1 Tax=Ensete ventricosum TaxID=4639 RepID=A0AAV8RYI4_ENSVE|nr:hypothetical protein OPV22_002615 [Ensete ventricosum]
MSLRQRNPKQDQGSGDDIVELREELLGSIVHDGGGGAMKAIKKKAKQLLDGQNPKKQQKKKKEKEKRNKNRIEEEQKQRSWAANPPPPLAQSYSFDASFTSAKGCCLLPPIMANPRGDLKVPKKPSNHNLLLRSLIERNDFYCKECNVHLR